ncbi:MAG: hypothetical protein NTNFB02_11270 [Nitrospira sp.]
MVSESERREAHSPSSASSANKNLFPASAENTMRVSITPPYLDPNSHEARYEIDVVALARG